MFSYMAIRVRRQNRRDCGGLCSRPGHRQTGGRIAYLVNIRLEKLCYHYPAICCFSGL